ncbi:methylated-DNA--[protein]-cysteine S-methyltransferase [Halioxenophilus aromaticivorans]|uniref:Methylated-DNA--protein-cysteine methyltransferase n=1 Tax=Halioxenophilus aromaticivorans TaxID=1306992 RepID=A0AAV3TZD7_9ALTE
MTNLFNRYHTTLASPLGEVLITGDGEHINGVYLTQHKDFLALKQNSQRQADVFEQACQQLQEYFAGTRQQFDLPLKQPGTEFQQTVWQALQKLPAGKTVSYGDICQAINKPRAFQAVGAANGANKIAIIVPCHRVVGKNGSLTGYAGGLTAKQWLLDHEKGHSIR